MCRSMNTSYSGNNLSFSRVCRRQSESVSVEEELLQRRHRGSVDRHGGQRIQETPGRAGGLRL